MKLFWTLRINLLLIVPGKLTFICFSWLRRRAAAKCDSAERASEATACWTKTRRKQTLPVRLHLSRQMKSEESVSGLCGRPCSQVAVGVQRFCGLLNECESRWVRAEDPAGFNLAWTAGDSSSLSGMGEEKMTTKSIWMMILVVGKGWTDISNPWVFMRLIMWFISEHLVENRRLCAVCWKCFLRIFPPIQGIITFQIEQNLLQVAHFTPEPCLLFLHSDLKLTDTKDGSLLAKITGFLSVLLIKMLMLEKDKAPYLKIYIELTLINDSLQIKSLNRESSPSLQLCGAF